jgi:hypothetical protein
MRRVAVGALALVTVIGGPSMVGQDLDDPPPPDLDTTMAAVLAKWPKQLSLPERWLGPGPERPTGSAPLAAPSMTEPFEIGEALNDPGRVEDAVVSLLTLMRIGIVPEGTPMPRASSGVRLRMTEAEVRSLIAMGKADADAAVTSPDGPAFTFADLHRSLSPMLGGVSVEQLADRFAQAYEKNPEWLVPQVLQGRPVEPDAPFLRTQLWLLLADAVAPARGAAGRADRGGPRLVFARALVQTPVVNIWGAGVIVPDPRVLQTPDARFTNEEWEELVTRLPAFANGLLSLTPARAHEKHGGAGNAVQIQGRLNANAPAMVSSITGRILLTGKSAAFSIAGLPIAWDYESKILQHGAMSVPPWTQDTIGANNVAQLTFTPKDEVAKGRGELMRDSGRVDAYMSPRDIIVALYNVPAAAQNVIWGQVHVGSTDLAIEWHALDTLRLELLNEYRVRIVGGLQRDGSDWARGVLELAPDGTYHGEVTAVALPSRTVLPGADCRHGAFAARQRMDVIGTPITEQDSRGQREGAFYNVVRSSPQFFEWDSGKPADYLGIEFYPREAPYYLRLDKAGNLVQRSRPRCYNEIGGPLDPSGVRTPNYAPLNAAQWTVEHAGYAIAIPAPGEELAYKDLTGASKFFQSAKGIAGAIQQLAAGTDSKWYVKINIPPAK